MLLLTYKFGFDDVNYLNKIRAAEEEGWGLWLRPKSQKVKHFHQQLLFNTITMTLTITAERLAEIKELLREWEDKTTHGLMDLQQLLGKLNFTCNTVRSGRVLMSRSINDLKCFPWLGRWKVTTEFVGTYSGILHSLRAMMVLQRCHLRNGTGQT